jgi:hypothetical protein
VLDVRATGQFANVGKYGVYAVTAAGNGAVNAFACQQKRAFDAVMAGDTGKWALKVFQYVKYGKPVQRCNDDFVSVCHGLR